MSDRLTRILVARALGRWIPPPLRPFIELLYRQLDYIESARDFLLWLRVLRRLPAVYRKTGVRYDIVGHWSSAIQETPMDFFDAARTEMREWGNILIRIEDSTENYVKFWNWVANPFQVRMWLGEVVRKFYSKLWAEHNEMLEAQRNPDSLKNKETSGEAPSEGAKPAPEGKPGEKGKEEEKSALDPAEADNWKDAEMIERRIQQLQEKAEGKGLKKAPAKAAPSGR